MGYSGAGGGVKYRIGVHDFGVSRVLVGDGSEKVIWRIAREDYPEGVRSLSLREGHGTSSPQGSGDGMLLALNMK